ncbi:MAG: ABC transporter ATP-binding protein [Corallococcus sp.]|nr:ABC transporter ATP-binding protein [Corallococcus sp.]MCM1359842.1 ABC transporter ATP-binding protein [Corallococcus sp.]MCM1395276.1 ABC transporter ATP-binding protein [Corallococcus sp.]
MLEVKNLCKTYPAFRLQNVNFILPEGEIVGFVGQNGAGKTTALKCIMRAVVPDSGTVTVNGLDMKENEEQIKQYVSFTSGAFEYFRNDKIRKIAAVYGKFYSNWEDEQFENYCKTFDLDLNKRVKELSAGMKVKFALALALSHNAKIFIFDEPTSGLDPIARDELLDLFRDVVSDGESSILFSTHITSDLDKCADRILFINKGKIVLDSPKDELLESHALIKGGSNDLTENLKSRCVAVKTNSFGFSALIKRGNLTEKLDSEKPTLDDVIVFYGKENEQ